VLGVQGSGFSAQFSGFRVQGSGCRVVRRVHRWVVGPGGLGVRVAGMCSD
jgi:hypothetical protein